MKIGLFGIVAALFASVALVSCGGGGGSPGSSSFGSGAGGSTGGSDTGGGGAPGAYTVTLDVQRAGASTSQISSSETVQAVATVLASDGTPVQGVVVSFAEQGASVLKLSPASGTALTDAAGKAGIDIRAADASQTGATTMAASATVATVGITGSKSIQISAGGNSGGTPATPAAMNFVGSTPSGTAIVVKGAGGSGRTESAILGFRVVDAANAPVSGAAVNFTINGASGGATISPTSAVTNSDGQVTVTVSSGTQPASIIVTATVAGVAAVSTQSDTLIVSNDVVLPAGFEIVAEKYNLDGRFTGDSTKITAYVRDQFGNPVADGVAVSFTTDYGAVALSTLGGCTTLNGKCSVDFRVQNPRGDGVATVVGTVRIGDSNVVANSLQINMAGATSTPYLALNAQAGGVKVTSLQLDNTCKKTFELYLSDGNGRSTAVGTTISAPSTSTGVAVSVKTGSPVLDQLDRSPSTQFSFSPTLFSIEIDLSSTDLTPACDGSKGLGTLAPEAFFRLEFKTPNNLVFSQRVDLLYPH